MTDAEGGVHRLRWWHRRYKWVGHAGWVYRWERPNWVGHLHGYDEIWLHPGLDTAGYGPFFKLYYKRWPTWAKAASQDSD